MLPASVAPIVTILLPTYNRQLLLDDCLDSILAQTYPHYQVEILDNGSMPPVVLPPYIANDSRFRLTRIEDNRLRRQLIFSRIRDTTTPYLAFLFDDDRWTPEKLSEQITALETRPEIVACFTHAAIIDDHGAPHSNPPPPYPHIFHVSNLSRAEWVRRFFHYGNCLCQPSAVIRTQALIKSTHDLPAIQLWDFAIWIKLLGEGDLHIIEKPLTLFRVFTSGANESAPSVESINRLNYETSRILHLFRELPGELLTAAFSPKFSQEPIDTNLLDQVLYNEAVRIGSINHFRFATELAEASYQKHVHTNNMDLAAIWFERYSAAAGQSRSILFPCTISNTQHLNANKSTPPDTGQFTAHEKIQTLNSTESIERKALPTNKNPAHRLARVGLLTADSPLGACFNLRLGYVLSLLSAHIEVIYIGGAMSSRQKKSDEECISNCDIFIVQRAFPSIDNTALLEKLRATRKPILYETDDLLDELPPENAEYGYYAPRIPHLQNFIKNTHLIVASTDALARHYSSLGLPAIRFGNQLSSALWQTATQIQQQANASEECITIGFAGTIARGRDLAIIEESLLRIARTYGDQVKIVLWGAATESLRTLDNVSIINIGVAYPLYPRRLASLGFDIGLAPLEDTAFNRCKSDLKWLEYSALGIATVVSDIPVYAEAKAHELAIAVPNEADAWYSALAHLIENAQERRALGRRAQDYVLRERSLEGHIHEYVEILNSILPGHLHLPAGEALTLTPLRPLHADEITIPVDAYRDWTERRTIQEVDAEVLAERMMSWPQQPHVTLFSVASANEFELLAETTDALQDQLYPNWRFIVISDQPNPDPIFDQAEFLGWVQVDRLDNPTGLAELGNTLLEQVGGDIFAWLPTGTRLASHALLLIADRFMEAGTPVAAVYTDHDHFDREGVHRPQLKPAFDLEWLRSTDYIGPAVFFKTADVLALGGFQPYPDAMAFDLLLRLAEHPEVAIVHQADVLLSIPDRDLGSNTIARQVALEQHLARCNSMLQIQPGALEGSFRIEPVAELVPPVSIIIAAKDGFHLLEACLESLFSHTDYPDYEVVVVDNGSVDPDVHHLYALLQQAGHPLRVIPGYEDYVLAPALNRGASAATGSVLVFILADCVFRDSNWLTRLVLHAQRDEVGVVGPLVIQPEFGQVESAGLFLGSSQDRFGTSRPGLRGLQLGDDGYMGMLRTQRTVSAVSCVGLTVCRARFEALEGFDERFVVSQFDIDLCLRAAEQGWKTLYTPYSRIIHHQNSLLAYLISTDEASVAYRRQKEADQVLLFEQWASRIGDDPHISPHLSMNEDSLSLEADFPLAWPTTTHHRARVLGFPLIGGSGEYRVKMPFKGLSEAGWVYAEFARPTQARLPSVAEMLRLAPDCILLHQRIGPMVDAMLDAWRKILPDIRIVFGLDDRMDAIPFKSNLYMMHKRGNPDARNKLRQVIRRSDVVVVSTEPLAELVLDIARDVDVRVIPNSLVRSTWADLQPKRRLEGKPRVGWVGAHQHRGDLELMIPVLEATHELVDWVFMGMWLPEFQGLVKEKHPAVNFIDYPAAIAALDLDLAIAPLEINPFNEAKSNLRLLEYGILGYPVICTDIYPYQTMDAPVLRLPNQPKRWIEAILDKVADRDALQREGAVLREWVMRHFLLEQHLPAWNDALLKS